MTLLERRRQMMSRKAEPEWDYVVTEKYPDSEKLIRLLVNIEAGQHITIAWGGCTLYGNLPTIWGLYDGASFAETTATRLQTRGLPETGQRTYTVISSGILTLGGIQNGSSTYAFGGDYIKARIT